MATTDVPGCVYPTGGPRRSAPTRRREVLYVRQDARSKEKLRKRSRLAPICSRRDAWRPAAHLGRAVGLVVTWGARSGVWASLLCVGSARPFEVSSTPRVCPSPRRTLMKECGGAARLFREMTRARRGPNGRACVLVRAVPRHTAARRVASRPAVSAVMSAQLTAEQVGFGPLNGTIQVRVDSLEEVAQTFARIGPEGVCRGGDGRDPRARVAEPRQRPAYYGPPGSAGPPGEQRPTGALASTEPGPPGPTTPQVESRTTDRALATSASVRQVTTTTGVHRLAFIDGLRGLAAVYVVISHVWDTVFTRRPPSVQSLREFTAFLGFGRFAVTLFIVVSGFSIGLGAWRGGLRWPRGTRNYVTRRFTRIWPPYAAAVSFISSRCDRPLS